MSTREAVPAETDRFVPGPDAPQWFVDNLRQPGESRHATVVDEATGTQSRVHFLSWNWHNDTRPTLLLLHGFSGHANWWSYLAPFFADRYRVAAIDLPGMGDSDHLAAYDHDCFARGIIAVLRQHGIARATIIGHSFGGAQAARAMAMAPELFEHGIIVDTMMRFGDHRPTLLDGRKRHRVRASRADCIADFRLMPPQPVVLQPLVDFIAFHSCTPTTDGWQWKFDPGLRNFGEISGTSIPAEVPTRVDCVYGELSMFSADGMPQKVLESFANHGELVMIPDAHHHLMLDHPLELVDALNRLLVRAAHA